MKIAETAPQENPPATERVGKLIAKYALPAIASSLVSSLYNIVDQVFVGRSIGELGNAATNVAFPFVMMITAAVMVFGMALSIQPIIGFNCGAGNAVRVKEVFHQAARGLFRISMSAFLCFQLCPRLIIDLFGTRNQRGPALL